MKTIFNKFLVLSLLIGMFASCDDAVLDEVPLDFYSPESAFSDVSGFEAALTGLYARERGVYYNGGDVNFSLLFGTDTFTEARYVGFGTDEKIIDFQKAFAPTKYVPKYFWDENYKVISSANVIIKGAEVSSLPQDKLAPLVVEAKFFRAKAYRDLVYLYGDVPILLEPVTTRKDDFVRAPKKEVLEQMVKDFQEAADKLPSISAVKDGKISNIVAYHYLAETLISLGRNAEAVVALNKVIGDPNVKLMTARFGRRISVFGKDVYWDLFQRGNQNRASGNKEALWVAQIQEDVPGGLVVTTQRNNNVLERMHVPAVWSLTDHKGKAGFLGRASNDNVGGFGVSFLQPTPYLDATIWPAGYVGDMRCNNANFIKDAIYDNPASLAFGKSINDPLYRSTNRGTTPAAGSWRFYKWFIKATTPGDHPTLMMDPAQINGFNQGGSGGTYHDMYYLRLSESLLLRAEAYLNLSQPQKAADDINVVRNRALATPVTPGEVTIDYILDERARELCLEEQRSITLRRLGKFTSRVILYNPYSKPFVLPFHELMPIPQNTIEANLGAVMKQNPGY
ncbi:MAG: RagB/SusD family nutrient uptake outer membrane protein [Flavobacterium sp.]|nr:RagB/SusD family nutrient uptake outer membrane protein [Flavobacterium sp.]